MGEIVSVTYMHNSGETHTKTKAKTWRESNFLGGPAWVPSPDILRVDGDRIPLISHRRLFGVRI